MFTPYCSSRAVWILCALIALAALPGLRATGVAADAGANASCAGIESSSVSPPGSSVEEAGGRAQLAKEIKAIGGPPGATWKLFAQLRAGSHEQCDAAFGGG